MHEVIPTTRCKGSKTILEQNMQTESLYHKIRMEKNMGKEFEGRKAEILLDSLRAAVKNIINRKT